MKRRRRIIPSVQIALGGLLLLTGCAKEEVSCPEACEMIVERYGACREDLNGPESCKQFCDEDEGKKEVARVYECLDQSEFSCAAFSDECDSEIFITIVVRRDAPPDHPTIDELSAIVPASCYQADASGH